MKIAACLIASVTLSAPGGAWAQVVTDCDVWIASARHVDWSDPTRTFANGAIRLIALDTAEPAAAAEHLMVLLPAPEDTGELCALISAGSGGLGFLSVDLSRADALYDPTRGLTVRVPATEALPVHPTPLSVEVRVNQQTGAVHAAFGPP